MFGVERRKVIQSEMQHHSLTEEKRLLVKLRKEHEVECKHAKLIR